MWCYDFLPLAGCRIRSLQTTKGLAYAGDMERVSADRTLGLEGGLGPRPGMMVAALAGVLGVTASARAGTWTVTPSLSVSAIYDDNLFFNDARLGATGLRAGPALIAEYQGSARFRLLGRAAVDSEYFGDPQVSSWAARRSAGLTARYRLGAHTTASLSGDYALSAYAAEVLAELPEVTTVLPVGQARGLVSAKLDGAAAGVLPVGALLSPPAVGPPFAGNRFCCAFLAAAAAFSSACLYIAARRASISSLARVAVRSCSYCLSKSATINTHISRFAFTRGSFEALAEFLACICFSKACILASLAPISSML